MLVPGLLLVAFVAQAAPAAPKPPASPARKVALRFAWPDGLQAKVKVHVSETLGGLPLSKATTTSTQLVVKKGEELRIVTSDRRVEGEGDAKGIHLERPIPVQVVSPEGDHLRLDGLDHALDAQLGGLAGNPLGGLMGASVTSAMEESWGFHVGLWKARELTFGQPIELTAPAPLALTGADAAMHQVLTATGQVPCRQGERQPRCVRLTFRLSATPAGLAAVSKVFEQNMAPIAAAAPDLAIQVEARRVEQEGELVTEPGTLIPHRLKLQEVTELVTKTRLRGAQTMSSVRITEYAYEYTER